MGAACCAGAAVAGGAASAGPSSLIDGTIYSFLSAIPIALYHYYPQITIVVATLLVLGISSLYLLLILLTPETKTSSPSELTFLSTSSKEPQPLPSLLDALPDTGLNATVQLSVVVPAFNEKERLPVMLKETVEFLEALKAGKKSLVQGLDEKLSNRSDGTSGIDGPALTANGSSTKTSVHAALHTPLTSYEILIVDDGSKDDTHQVALDFARRHTSAIRVIRLVSNRGKGGAVRHGVLHSRGHLVLFADADGATSFGDLSKLCSVLASVVTKVGHGVAVGSRAHMVKSDAVVKRSFVRNFLMHGFHLFLTLLLRPPTLAGLMKRLRRSGGECRGRRALPVQPEIKDTQCGFKLFTRPTAQLVFPASHIDGWIFDVELLILAQTSSALALQQQPPQDEDQSKDVLQRLPIPIAEVSVHWAEVGGSKIDLVRDSIRMALDLVVIRANYKLGRWGLPRPALVE